MVRRPALLLFATLALTALGREASAGSTYLAIGDSVAFGETDFTKNPSNGDRGYVSLFADALRNLNGGVRPNVVNLGFDGETTGSFFSGTGNTFGPDASLMNTNYGVPTIQNTMMLSTIAAAAAAGNPVGYVTISLGANDLFQILSDPNFFSLPPEQQQATVLAALGIAQNNLATLLLELRSLLPAASIYMLGYYNPFGAFGGTPLGDFTPAAVQGLNSVILGVAQAFGATYIDTYSSFLGHETEYTYILTDYLGVPNVHPNEMGYSVIGARLTGVVPEPQSLVLACVGIAGVVLTRRFARR